MPLRNFDEYECVADRPIVISPEQNFALAHEAESGAGKRLVGKETKESAYRAGKFFHH